GRRMMKREITFRGKSLDNGEWVHGYYWEYLGRHFIKSAGAGVDCEINAKTLGEHTGLHDRLGQPLYEDDIIRGDHPTSLVVFYNRWAAGFRASRISDHYTHPSKSTDGGRLTKYL